MKKVIEQLIIEGNGSTRFYEKDGWDLNDMMSICSFLDEELYSYGLEENRSGTFIEVIKVGEE